MIRFTVLFALFWMAISLLGNCQSTNLSAKERYNMMTGDENYNQRYYNQAIIEYKKILKSNPNNAEVNFKIGRTYYRMALYNDAEKYLHNAIELDSVYGNDIRFLLGRSLQINKKLDKAMIQYLKYYETLSKRKKRKHVVNDYIAQIKHAKKLISQPLNVAITNMGTIINSKFRESSPAMPADGSVLYFTASRPGNKGGEIDPVANIYYQDVWICNKDSNTGKWLPSEPIFGDLNTDGHDAITSISANGEVMLLYKGTIGNGDIFYSKKNRHGEWRNPKPIEGNANSSYFETGACLTADEETMYFISERSGGEGNGDIWMAQDVGYYEYGESENLGEVVNSISDENSVFIHPNGKTLFFSSNRTSAIGGYDIFKTDLKNGKWTKPINLGYPINTLGDEIHFIVASDGQTAYISTKREDSYGTYDIYKIDLTNYLTPNAELKEGETAEKMITSEPISIIKGKVIDGFDATPLQAELTFSDSATGKVLATTKCSEGGYYYIQLDGDRTIKIQAKHPDFEPKTEFIYLPKTKSQTEVVTRSFVLNNGSKME